MGRPRPVNKPHIYTTLPPKGRVPRAELQSLENRWALVNTQDWTMAAQTSRKPMDDLTLPSEGCHGQNQVSISHQNWSRPALL